MGKLAENLIGQEFGTLKVVCRGHLDGVEKSSHAYWVVECSKCGDIKVVRSDNLKSGKIVSCGKCSKFKERFDGNM